MARFLYKLMQINKIQNKLSQIRTLSTTKCVFENYEGDGKTTVTILNKEYKHLVMFDTYGKQGFRLNNGIFVMGPVAAFPRTVLQWNIKSWSSLTPEAFSLFSVLEPKLDLLIIGTGEKRKLLNADVVSFLKEIKIQTEILPTEQACSIFNFLNVEGRCIAGAFVPPTNMQMYEDEFDLVVEHNAYNPFGPL